jgi:hypothetical protein
VKFPTFPTALIKKILFALLALQCLAAHTQTAPAKGLGGGTNKANSMISTLDHGPCVHKQFSLAFYVFQDSIYPGVHFCCNQALVTPPSIIDTLNRVFAPICVSFKACTTVVIPNYSLNKWSLTSMSNGIIANYHTDETINVYLPESLSDAPGTDAASSTYPPPSLNPLSYKNAIIIGLTGVVFPSGPNAGKILNTAEVAHVFGHFFGLPHTFDEIAASPPASPPPPAGVISQEWATRTSGNCYTHGDGFCDTEADPFPITNSPNMTYYRRPHIDEDCQYKYGLKDGQNNIYYPPVDNYMSVYRCRCRFSQEQYNAMAAFIKNHRLQLH